MNKIQELEKIYNEQLKGQLEEMEEERVKLRSKNITTNVLLAAAGILIATSFLVRSGAYSFVAMIFMVIVGIVKGLYVSEYKKFNKKFKEIVITKIVKLLGEDFTYKMYSGIARETFKESKLFLQGIDRYSAEDLVDGKVDKTEFIFSEIHAEYKTEHRDKDGHRHVSWHTIFKGLFFIADFNKNFNGNTVVVPDNSTKLFGGASEFFQKLSFRGKLIKLEDVDFEREFVVYSDDEIESRYILSSSLMERILDFKNKTGKRIHMSFVNSKVFVAVPYSENLFEANLNKSLLEFDTIKDYYNDLIFAISIIEDLNLNTRIWDKQ